MGLSVYCNLEKLGKIYKLVTIDSKLHYASG